MKNNSKPSIAVGISAFNEEESIGQIISSVINQNIKDFDLKKIYVVSDGSTDMTVEIVKKIDDKRIFLIDSKKKEGLTKSINKIVDKFQEDILVKVDADVSFETSDTINNLCLPFVKNKNLGYACGRLKPRKPITVVEKIINHNRSIWDNIKYSIKEGKSVLSCAGGLFALSKDNLINFKFPNDVWTDIGYLYFWTKCNNKDYVSVPNAIVRFRPPMNLDDYKKQKERYDREGEILKKHFSEEQIKSEYFVGKKVVFKNKIIGFFKNPLLSIAFLFLSLLVNVSKNTDTLYLNGWEKIASTKQK